MIVVIFGVSGVGKTTVGKIVAQDRGWKFYDADDFHSTANIEKMRNGRPLTDEDRQPWLQSLRDLIQRCLTQNENAVLACSALKKKYRDELRVNPDVKFVFLRAERAQVVQHLKNRHGHYFDPKLLDSQFTDLEEPKSDEDTLTVELAGEPRDLASKIESILRQHGR